MDNAVPPRRVAVLATLDTKGDEAAYLADLIRGRGHVPVVVDIGLSGTPAFAGDIDRTRIAELASPAGADEADRTAAMRRVGGAAGRVLGEEIAAGRLDGVIGIGGGTGRWISAEAMATLPLGVPKLIVTTVANADGRSDVIMAPSVADVAGLNRLLRRILSNAAGAICGMVEQPAPAVRPDVPSVAMTMFGVTTTGGDHVRRYLEEAGFEVVVFHATGAGGDTMERLVREGMFDAVVDWTTSEITDLLVGGICAASPTRLDAASELGIPQVIVPGAVDVINVRPPIPEAFADRTPHWHLPNVPLFRANADESAQVGAWIAAKLARATGPAQVVIPAAGFSSLDIAGGDFADPTADSAFEDALRSNLPERIPVRTEALHINDPAFARIVADTLISMLATTPAPPVRKEDK